MAAGVFEEALSACQDRKREGDMLFGRGKFEEAAAVYGDADDDLLQLPGKESLEGAFPLRCLVYVCNAVACGVCTQRARAGLLCNAVMFARAPSIILLLCTHAYALVLLHNIFCAGAALTAHKVGVMRMILLQNRAACCYRLERFAEAVELCTAALEHEPHAEQVLLQRGRCLQAMGNYVAAYRDFWDLSVAKPEAAEPKRQMQTIAALCPEAPEVRVRMLVCVGAWIRLCL
jgi:tetratricopeptide (TPR) repeat protein